MIEITKDTINLANNVDKIYPKTQKGVFIKKFFKENKILTCILFTFFALAIINATLIYSFCNILLEFGK